jgi:bacteriorhodopsin
MADITAIKNSNGIAFLVGAGIVYEIVAAACSSPQTAEINAHSRASTLMKWVYIGLGQAALLVVIAAIMETSPWPVLAGGALAGALMWGQYAHARKAGLASDLPGTES